METTLQSAAGFLGLFAEPTRIRLLALVEDEPLSVSELTRITGLPQSRVSTHLGRLRDAGLVRDQRRGNSTFYRMPEEAARTPVWVALRESLEDETLAADSERARTVLQARGDAGTWVDEVAGQMERHYSPGRTWEALARAVVPLLDLGDVLDVGSGDGAIAYLVAPRCRSITCLDRNARALEAAQKRLHDVPNVAFRAGDMHDLPFEAETFDQVLCFNVLTYTRDALRALHELARVLRPGGTLVVVTLDAHTHLRVASNYDHVVAGYAPQALAELAVDAGLEVASSAVTSRERRKPYFAVATMVCRKPEPADRGGKGPNA